MARPLLVPALGLELEDPQLRTALVADDLRLDADLLEPVGVEDAVLGTEQDRLERDRVALGALELLDQQRLPGLDPVLLAAGLDDCVCHLLPTPTRSCSRPSRANAGGHLCGPGVVPSMVAPPRAPSPGARRRPARPSRSSVRRPRCGPAAWFRRTGSRP